MGAIYVHWFKAEKCCSSCGNFSRNIDTSNSNTLNDLGEWLKCQNVFSSQGYLRNLVTIIIFVWDRCWSLCHTEEIFTDKW